MRLAVPLLGLLLLAAESTVLAWQYPGGQYPGQYPPNTYPTQLPGGIPVGIPVPEIKLPRRGTKDKPDEVKTTLASVDGTLRKLREKDLFLQASPQRLLRFRLL